MPRSFHRTVPPAGPRAAALTSLGWRPDATEWTLWLASPGEPLEQTLPTLRPPRADAVVGAVPGLIHLANKRNLWVRLVRAHGEAAPTIQPRSWLPDVSADAADLAGRSGRFVVKEAYVQRRKGISIATSGDDALVQAGEGDRYVIQRLVDDPLLVQGHCISLRVYLLIVRDGGGLHAFLHRWGPVVYAPGPLAGGAAAFDRWVTRSGDWLGPPGAPLSLPLLASRLQQEGRDPAPLLRGLGRALRAAASSVARDVIDDERLREHRCFELLGADFAVDANLAPWLLEINRKPMLDPRCDDEAPARAAVFADALQRGGLGVGGEAFVPIGSWT